MLAASALAGRTWAKQPESSSEKKTKQNRNHRERTDFRNRTHIFHQQRHFRKSLYNCRLPQRCPLRRNWETRYTERTVLHDRSRPPPSLLQWPAEAAGREAEISSSVLLPPRSWTTFQLSNGKVSLLLSWWRAPIAAAPCHVCFKGITHVIMKLPLPTPHAVSSPGSALHRQCFKVSYPWRLWRVVDFWRMVNAAIFQFQKSPWWCINDVKRGMTSDFWIWTQMRFQRREIMSNSLIMNKLSVPHTMLSYYRWRSNDCFYVSQIEMLLFDQV